MTIKDVWTRQLMSIKGISGEKAASIVKDHPTNCILRESLGKETPQAPVGKMNKRSVLGMTQWNRLLSVLLNDEYNG